MLRESQTACRHRYRGDDRQRLENKKPRSDARLFANVPLRLLIKLSLLAAQDFSSLWSKLQAVCLKRAA